MLSSFILPFFSLSIILSRSPTLSFLKFFVFPIFSALLLSIIQSYTILVIVAINNFTLYTIHLILYFDERGYVGLPVQIHTFFFRSPFPTCFVNSSYYLSRKNEEIQTYGIQYTNTKTFRIASSYFLLSFFLLSTPFLKSCTWRLCWVAAMSVRLLNTSSHFPEKGNQKIPHHDHFYEFQDSSIFFLFSSFF